MAASLLLFFLAVYGIGCGVSQSLMSLGGSVFAIAGFVLALSFLKKNNSSPGKGDFVTVTEALVLVGYLVLDLVLREWTTRSGHTLGALPLHWVPLFGLVYLKKIPREKFGWPLFLTTLGLLIAVGRALFQVTIQKQLATGFFGNSIYYSYNLLPALVFFTELVLSKISFGRFKQEWSLFAAALAFLGIFLSETRMAWIVAAGFLALRCCPVLWKKWGWKKTVLTSLGVLAVIVGVTASQPRIREKLVRSFSSEDPSRHWRLVAWQHNFELFKANPLFGVGPEKNGIDTALHPELAGHWEPHHLIFAHSIYFQAAADSGLVGLLLILFYWARLGKKNAVVRSVVWVAAIGGLTENIFNNSKALHPVLFYTLLSLLIFRESKKVLERG